MPALASVPDVLTACLACSWVHESPWRCPRSATKTVRVFRFGEANTLLLTPNDWSTLSNGTVDGEPTGLHRFVGENPTSGDGRSTDCIRVGGLASGSVHSNPFQDEDCGVLHDSENLQEEQHDPKRGKSSVDLSQKRARRKHLFKWDGSCHFGMLVGELSETAWNALELGPTCVP